MGEQSAAVATEPLTSGPVIARAGRYYRVARYLMTLLLIGYGCWSIYDGFVSWPNWPITHPDEKPKTDTDIMLNKVLGVVLPPMGLFILFWALFNSRGEYRLEDGVVYVPGHPPIPLDNIHSINRELWDRKGIAYVEYELTNAPASRPKGAGPTVGPVKYEGVSQAQRSTFKLDDFVYDREATDKIFKTIEEALLKAAATASPPTQPAPTKLPPRPKL
jgi:hypothetical protein